MAYFTILDPIVQVGSMTAPHSVLWQMGTVQVSAQVLSNGEIQVCTGQQTSQYVHKVRITPVFIAIVLIMKNFPG